jgi:hypothetical protein
VSRQQTGRTDPLTAQGEHEARLSAGAQTLEGLKAGERSICVALIIAAPTFRMEGVQA